MLIYRIHLLHKFTFWETPRGEKHPLFAPLRNIDNQDKMAKAIGKAIIEEKYNKKASN